MVCINTYIVIPLTTAALKEHNKREWVHDDDGIGNINDDDVEDIKEDDSLSNHLFEEILETRVDEEGHVFTNLQEYDKDLPDLSTQYSNNIKVNKNDIKKFNRICDKIVGKNDSKNDTNINVENNSECINTGIKGTCINSSNKNGLNENKSNKNREIGDENNSECDEYSDNENGKYGNTFLYT